jgi:hypothetical protein
MIPGRALAQWLADTEAQQRSQARIKALAGKWSVHPLMTQTERRISELKHPAPEALLAIARRFIDDDEIGVMMREMIATSRLDPFFRPPIPPIVYDIHQSLLLYHHSLLSIAVGVTSVDTLATKKLGRDGAGSINFSGFVTLMRFVDAGGATLSFWEAPRITDGFSSAEAGRCRLVSRRRVADGEEIVVDGRHQSFVVEHATSDLLYFQAVARAGSAPVCTEYDADSCDFIGASCTDEAASRVQMMVSLLRAMDHEEAVPLLAETLWSWPFNTRWHIMREMLALDAEAALPTLRRLAAEDPHPDIRAAARQTLAAFFQETSAPETEGEAIACRA